MRAPIPVLLLGACVASAPPGAHSGGSAPATGHTGAPEPIDWEATCAGTWPADACAVGDCTPLPVNDRYVEGWEQVFAARSGWSAEALAEQVELRAVEHAAALQSSRHTLTVELTVGWVTFLVVDAASAPGADPTAAEILEAWRRDPQLGGVSVPLVTPTTPLALGPDDVRAAIAACEAQLGEPLDPAGFCRPRVPMQRTSADEPELSFDFWGPSGRRRVAHLGIDAVSGQSVCGFTAAAVF